MSSGNKVANNVIQSLGRFDMSFSKRSKYVLISLLISLNFIIRIPSVPHEIGNDGFTIHILANSIFAFGYAKWWIHPSSIFGFYPYSYASSVPFVLSGISQCTGIGMEETIRIFCVFIGLFSAFTAYLLAGAIWNNDIFKFFVAFSYSLSPGILAFSTWDVSTRGLFIVLLPLFIYLLLKTRVFIKRNIILSFSLFIVLMSIHHYFYLTIPIIIGYITVILFFLLYNKLKNYFDFFEMPKNFINIAFIISFFGMFLMQFFTRTFIKAGRYEHLYSMLTHNVRYTGILVVFAIGGFSYLIFKHNKKFEGYFFLLALLFYTPFIYMQTYAHFFSITFLCVLIGIALANVARVEKQKRKYALAIIIIMLLLSVSFSGFYQHWRTSTERSAGMWYMKETTYAGGSWIGANIDTNKKLVCYEELTSRRIFAVSKVPSLVGRSLTCMLTYGFADLTNINVSKNSPLSTEFYIDSPYILDSTSSTPSGAFFTLSGQEFDSYYGKRIIDRYDLSYAIENKKSVETTFIQSSLHEIKERVYDNGKIYVWCLD